MVKYKLKKEARQFFSNDMAEKVKPIGFWESQNIHINLLDEVDFVYIEYGKPLSESGSSLSSWDNINGERPKAKFYFTIHIEDITNSQYKQLEVPKMMDEMQKTINQFVRKYTES